MERREQAAIGIRVKSGWGAIVVLSGTPTVPRLITSGRLELADPAHPFTKQPYHAAQNTLERDQRKIDGRLEVIRRAVGRSVDELLDGQGPGELKVVAVTLVVGSLTDPATIASQHMRAHAMEGRTFWTVLRDCFAARGLECRVIREKDLSGAVSVELAMPADELRARVTSLGRGTTGWRAEQKLAAMGALAGLPCRG